MQLAAQYLRRRIFTLTVESGDTVLALKSEMNEAASLEAVTGVLSTTVNH